MIITWRVAARIALLLVVAAVLQLAFLSRMSMLGVTPDLLPVVAIALGLLGGAVVGAVCGFALGLITDSLLLQTLGVTSLVLITVGYLAGRWRESFDITSALVPPLLAAALTFLGTAMFAVIQLMLGVEAPVSLLLLREILVKAILGGLLAIPIYPAIRRLLRPALVEDSSRSRTRRRRRTRRGPSLAPIRLA